MLLSVKNIGLSFGSLVAIENLSFDVKKSEFFGIAGPNGAGKTTLFNILAGHYRSTGQIIFDGHDITSLKPHQVCYRGIARTFQIPTIFPSLTVQDNIKFGIQFGNSEKNVNIQTTIDKLLTLMELNTKKDIEGKNIDLFTKKKTILATAMATKPKMLLLDEPIGGLTPDEIDKFIVLIRQIREDSGVTILMIEHLMEYLMDLSDRILILSFGREICTGPPADVVKDRRVIENYLGEE
jgi:branched-chain amino acid transport system ATP-binding protein